MSRTVEERFADLVEEAKRIGASVSIKAACDTRSTWVKGLVVDGLVLVHPEWIPVPGTGPRWIWLAGFRAVLDGTEEDDAVLVYAGIEAKWAIRFAVERAQAMRQAART